MDKNDARIEARVPQQAYDALLMIAEHYGVTLSQAVRWAIWEYVATEGVDIAVEAAKDGDA